MKICPCRNRGHLHIEDQPDKKCHVDPTAVHCGGDQHRDRKYPDTDRQGHFIAVIGFLRYRKRFGLPQSRRYFCRTSKIAPAKQLRCTAQLSGFQCVSRAAENKATADF